MWAQKNRREAGDRAIDGVDPYAAEGGVGYGVGDSATFNDSTCLHPSESISDCRKSWSVSLVIGILRAFAS
jgi:hypothetical protein